MGKKRGKHRRRSPEPSPSISPKMDEGPFGGLEDFLELDLAQRLGVTVPELRRMRAEPAERVSQAQWVILSNLRQVAAARRIDPPPGPLDVGDPYEPLHRLRRCRATEEWPSGPPFRKPIVGVVGAFDAGKSTLINTLVGSTHVRSRYTPTTMTAAHLRHSDDRPAFLEEPWVAVEGYDHSKPLTGRRWKECGRAAAATQAALDLLGQPDADSLAFLDSPVLRAADIIDTPGWGDREEQTQRARDTWSALDVIIWCSSYIGFLPGTETAQLAALVAGRYQLPRSPTPDRLSVLFIVMTQADATRDFDDDEVAMVRAAAASRLLDDIVRLHPKSAAARTLTVEDLAARIFTFSAVSGSRSQALRDDLGRLLGGDFPSARLAVVARAASEVLAWPERSRLIPSGDS